MHVAFKLLLPPDIVLIRVGSYKCLPSPVKIE